MFIKYLLDNGVDPEISNLEEETPLKIAKDALIKASTLKNDLIFTTNWLRNLNISVKPFVGLDIGRIIKHHGNPEKNLTIIGTATGLKFQYKSLSVDTTFSRQVYDAFESIDRSKNNIDKVFVVVNLRF